MSFDVDIARCRDVSFSLLALMELILKSCCNLLYFHSNIMNNEKCILVEKRGKVIALNITVITTTNRISR